MISGDFQNGNGFSENKKSNHPEGKILHPLRQRGTGGLYTPSVFMFGLREISVTVRADGPKTRHADAVRFRQSAGKLASGSKRYNDAHGNLRDVWHKGQKVDSPCDELEEAGF